MEPRFALLPFVANIQKIQVVDLVLKRWRLADMERRKYTRLNCNIASELVLPDGNVYTGVVKDISFTGAYFDADIVLGIGPGIDYADQEVTVVMQLPETELERQTYVKAILKGTVGFTAALHFTYMAPGEYLVFRNFLLRNAEYPSLICGDDRVLSHADWVSAIQAGRK